MLPRASPVLAALAFTLACAGGRPPEAPACSRDTDCDPGDVCVQNECRGASAGPDAGPLPDAGAAPDGGSQPDAGAATPGHLTLSPASAAASTPAGVPLATQTLVLGNDGGSALSFSISCSRGTVVSPLSGEIAAGATATAYVTPPSYASAAQQTVACVVSSANGGPLTYTLTVTVTPGGSPNAVGPGGGTVDLLDFVMTGDTRPPVCDLITSYPKAAFQAEVAAMVKLQPQFALDLGDHMFACSQSLVSTRAQMKLYTDAISAAAFTPQWFMTMGNHECEQSDCSTAPSDANFVAYGEALQSLSRQSLPYYKVDVQTRLGLARFVFLADNFASQAAQDWAEATLGEADRIAKYTIVAKHHPVTGTRTGPQWAYDTVLRHKYSLILTAHDHSYAHSTTAFSGRSIICGLGAANTSQTGFCRVQQRADGTLAFTAYDAYGNVRTDPSSTFSVTPQ